MLYKLKKFISMVFCLSLLILNTSCGTNSEILETENTQTESTQTVIDTIETTTTSIISTTTAETTIKETTEFQGFDYSSLVDIYDQDSFSEEMKAIEWNSSLIFYDKQSATDYLLECTKNCQERIGIIIPQGVEAPDNNYYKSIGLNVTGISYNQATLSDDVNTADYIVYTPKYANGTIIYNAYLNNDTSKLNSQQLQVYNIATDYIQNTLDTSKSQLEQEKQIFDYICNSTEYYNDDNVPENEYANFKSCVGVLLDGRSNCMGYSDTFYMLCNMAGLEVKYISETDMVHAWNLITLDGKEYLVDTTYADTSLENQPNYLYFNASWDFVSQEYTINDNNPTKNINATCDENYYFFADVFGSLNSNATDIYDDIIDLALKNDNNSVEIICTEYLPSNDEFLSNLRNKLPDELNKSISYIIVPYNSFTYILIDFKDS